MLRLFKPSVTNFQMARVQPRATLTTRATFSRVLLTKFQSITWQGDENENISVTLSHVSLVVPVEDEAILNYQLTIDMRGLKQSFWLTDPNNYAAMIQSFPDIRIHAQLLDSSKRPIKTVTDAIWYMPPVIRCLLRTTDMFYSGERKESNGFHSPLLSQLNSEFDLIIPQKLCFFGHFLYAQMRLHTLHSRQALMQKQSNAPSIKMLQAPNSSSKLCR